MIEISYITLISLCLSCVALGISIATIIQLYLMYKR